MPSPSIPQALSAEYEALQRRCEELDRVLRACYKCPYLCDRCKGRVELVLDDPALESA